MTSSMFVQNFRQPVLKTKKMNEGECFGVTLCPPSDCVDFAHNLHDEQVTFLFGDEVRPVKKNLHPSAVPWFQLA